MVRLFEQAASRAPASLAVDDGRERFSYAEAMERVRRLGAAISRAAPPGAVVVVALPVNALLPLAMLAVAGAGRVAALIDLHAPPQRRAALVKASGAVAALVDSAAGESLPGSRVPLLDVRRLSVEEAPLAELPETDPYAPAFILPTSGSTGEPKGIVNSQAALIQRAVVHVAACHIGPEDRMMPLSTPTSIAGLREVLTGLVTGASVHLAEPRGHELRQTLARIAAVRPTIVYAVPTLLRALFRVPGAERAFAGVRVLRLGGEAIHWADIAALRPHLPAGAGVLAAYSSTETVGAHWFVPPGAEPDAPTVPAGYIAPGSRFRIEDAEGRAVPDGEEGELVLRGRYIALGHWVGGRLLPGPMRPDPEDPLSRIFRTGDRGRLLPDGRLALLGRTDDMVKIAGQRVEPREVEATMRGWVEVDDAAVIVVGAAERRAQLVGFLVPRDGAGDGLAETARRRLAASLPASMQPARLHVIEGMPLNANAKPDRAALARMDAEAQAARPVVGADVRPEVAWAVAQAWKRNFGRRSLKADESFQAAGGDSLTLLRLAYDIEQRLGAFTFLPFDIFAPDMRPSEMAAAISRAGRQPPVRPDAALPTLFLLPGLNGDEPLLGMFRADLAERLCVVTLGYPGWRRSTGREGELERLAEGLAARIAREAPAGPIRLAGYSFGGVVAAAVAGKLLAAGREIGFLGLIDAAATLPPGPPQHGAALRNSIAGQGVMRQALRERRLSDALGMMLAQTLARPGLAPVLARLARLPAPPLPMRLRFAGAAWLHSLLRAEASRAWLARDGTRLPASVRAVLFRSAQRAPGEADDLGWSARCARLEIVEVPGSHHGMFDAGHRAVLAERFARAACGAGAG
jgi:acyl-coenzyme A synthetase/AMP-(fatty) acid ligase/thioesterase domain-containing protein